MSTVNKQKVFEELENPNNTFHKSVNRIEDDTDEFYRIDYPGLTNMSMVVDESSFNTYTSFQNKHEQTFMKNFDILNNRESNVAVQGLGGRQVLSSLLQVNYILADKHSRYLVPTGFEKIDTIENYEIYRNKLPLAFIHPVHHIYSEESMKNIVVKEELLLDGVFTENGDTVPEQIDNRIDYNLHSSSNYDGKKVEYSESQTKINFLINSKQRYDDIVIDYTLKPTTDRTEGMYTYFING